MLRRRPTPYDREYFFIRLRLLVAPDAIVLSFQSVHMVCKLLDCGSLRYQRRLGVVPSGCYFLLSCDRLKAKQERQGLVEILGGV